MRKWSCIQIWWKFLDFQFIFWRRRIPSHLWTFILSFGVLTYIPHPMSLSKHSPWWLCSRQGIRTAARPGFVKPPYPPAFLGLDPLWRNTRLTDLSPADVFSLFIFADLHSFPPSPLLPLQLSFLPLHSSSFLLLRGAWGVMGANYKINDAGLPGLWSALKP